MLYLQLPLVYPVEYCQIFHRFFPEMSYLPTNFNHKRLLLQRVNRTFSLFPFGQASPPNTAFRPAFAETLRAGRSSSSNGFRNLSPWSSSRYLIKPQGFVKVLIRISFTAYVFLRMLPSQVYAHSLIQKPFGSRQISATVPIVKVTSPSPYCLIQFLDDHLFR